jgi:Ig-like domain from next to BRCA1 gene
VIVNKLSPLWVILCLGALLLPACRGKSTAEAIATQPAPETVLTAAAETAAARMTQTAAVPPTEHPATPTPSMQVTLTVPAPVSPTLTVTPTVTISGEDKLEFVADVTVPDGTTFKPGDTFVKTWKLKNTGTSTWGSGHSLIFVSGEQMGAPASIPLSTTVPPGETTDVSVSLTAPQSPGSYFSFWALRGPAGNTFAVGPNGEQPFYVQIIVSGSGSGTAAPPGSSGNIVSNVSLVVDNADVQDTCPHTFYFVARFALNQPALVSYKLEAETGFELTLPAPSTVALDAGVHTLTYTLEFPADVSGAAQFHVTAPEDLTSNTVNFTLKCQ